MQQLKMCKSMACEMSAPVHPLLDMAGELAVQVAEWLSAQQSLCQEAELAAMCMQQAGVHTSTAKKMYCIIGDPAATQRISDAGISFLRPCIKSV